MVYIFCTYLITMAFLDIILLSVQLLAGLVVSFGAILFGVDLLDRLTSGINEVAELKKGNVSIGIRLAASVLAMTNIIQPGIESFLSAVSRQAVLRVIAGSLLALLAYTVLAVVGLSIAMKVLDSMFSRLADFKVRPALKNGNVAAAIFISGVLLAVSFILQAWVTGVVNAIGLPA